MAKKPSRKYVPELALLSIDIELNLRPIDAFMVSIAVDVFDVPRRGKCRRKKTLAVLLVREL